MSRRRAIRRIALLGVWAMAALCGCIRDELAPCPPLAIRLEVEDKNYFNVKAASRLGLEEIRSDELPFAEYVSTLYYRLTDAETGEVVLERPLSAVEGEEKRVEIAVPEEIPFGRYVLTAWGNLSARTGEALGDDPTRLALHPDRLPGTDVYLASDTLVYDESVYVHTVGMKRVKGKLIVSVEGMPEDYRYSEKRVTAISGQVDSRFAYSDSLSLRLSTVWQKTGGIVTKTLLAPSTAPAESLCNLRFYVGDSPAQDNWIAPEVVSLTMGRNELTVLRYIYDPCCCTFKVYILVNDNWELLHILDID